MVQKQANHKELKELCRRVQTGDKSAKRQLIKILQDGGLTKKNNLYVKTTEYENYLKRKELNMEV